MEKFFNIKCRYSGLKPKCAVIVATVRALKMHGGGPPVSAGKPLSAEYREENLDLVRAGTANLVRHIQNAKKFGVNVVVAVNKFKTDTDAEIEVVKEAAIDAGAFGAVMSNHWAEGGKGAADLAKAVVKACKHNKEENFRFLYDTNLPIKEKIGIISKDIYGADGVDYSDLAEKQIAQYEKAGFGKMPVRTSKICKHVDRVNRLESPHSSYIFPGLVSYVQYTGLHRQNTVQLQLRCEVGGCSVRISCPRPRNSFMRRSWLFIPDLW